MIDAAYRRVYDDIFQALVSELPDEAFWESALPSYQHRNPLMSWLFWKRIAVALYLCGSTSGKSVLDFGCGTGPTFKYLADSGCSITACESQFLHLTKHTCQRLGVEAEFCSDLQQLEGRQYDLIFALDVLEHVSNLEPILARLRGHCHRETRIIVSGPTESLIYRIGRRIAGFSGHYHQRDIYDVEAALGSQGFHRIELRRLYPPAVLFRISSWSSRF